MLRQWMPPLRRVSGKYFSILRRWCCENVVRAAPAARHARNIAQSMGGEVTLRNHPEGGLEARLTLPRSKEHTETTAASSGPREIAVRPAAFDG